MSDFLGMEVGVGGTMIIVGVNEQHVFSGSL